MSSQSCLFGAMSIVVVGVAAAVVGVLGLWFLATVACLQLYCSTLVHGFLKAPWLLITQRRPLPEDGESCSFPTPDGQMLRGTYWRTDQPECLGQLILCHELFGDSCCLSDQIEYFKAHGFNVFVFDFRNHGKSDAIENYQRLPWLTTYEVEDVLAAVDFLCSTPMFGHLPIGVYGVSKGGGAALAAAAQEKRIEVLVVDGVYPNRAMLVRYIRRYASIKSRMGWLWQQLPESWLALYASYTIKRAEQVCGCRYVDLLQAAPGVSQPTLLIHGQRDPYVSAEITDKLRRRMRGEVEVWDVPGATHNSSCRDAADLYYPRVVKFFRDHLETAVEEPSAVPAP